MRHGQARRDLHLSDAHGAGGHHRVPGERAAAHRLLGQSQPEPQENCYLNVKKLPKT